MVARRFTIPSSRRDLEAALSKLRDLFPGVDAAVTSVHQHGAADVLQEEARRDRRSAMLLALVNVFVFWFGAEPKGISPLGITFDEGAASAILVTLPGIGAYFAAIWAQHAWVDLDVWRSNLESHQVKARFVRDNVFREARAAGTIASVVKEDPMERAPPELPASVSAAELRSLLELLGRYDSEGDRAPECVPIPTSKLGAIFYRPAWSQRLLEFGIPSIVVLAGFGAVGWHLLPWLWAHVPGVS